MFIKTFLVNPRISPLGVIFILTFLDGILFEGGWGFYEGAYEFFRDKLHRNNQFKNEFLFIISEFFLPNPLSLNK